MIHLHVTSSSKPNLSFATRRRPFLISIISTAVVKPAATPSVSSVVWQYGHRRYRDPANQSSRQPGCTSPSQQGSLAMGSTTGGSSRNEPWQMKHFNSILALNSDPLTTLLIRLISFLTDVTHRASTGTCNNLAMYFSRSSANRYCAARTTLTSLRTSVSTLKGVDIQGRLAKRLDS